MVDISCLCPKSLPPILVFISSSTSLTASEISTWPKPAKQGPFLGLWCQQQKLSAFCRVKPAFLKWLTWGSVLSLKENMETKDCQRCQSEPQVLGAGPPLVWYWYTNQWFLLVMMFWAELSFPSLFKDFIGVHLPTGTLSSPISSLIYPKPKALGTKEEAGDEASDDHLFEVFIFLMFFNVHLQHFGLCDSH